MLKMCCVSFKQKTIWFGGFFRREGGLGHMGVACRRSFVIVKIVTFLLIMIPLFCGVCTWMSGISQCDHCCSQWSHFLCEHFLSLGFFVFGHLFY